MSRAPKCKKCTATKKCSRPGPITKNGYLNFLRDYRKKHCGRRPQLLIMQAARSWNRLREENKDIYRRKACKVSKRKKRKICDMCKKDINNLISAVVNIIKPKATKN